MAKINDLYCERIFIQRMSGYDGTEDYKFYIILKQIKTQLKQLNKSKFDVGKLL